MRGVYNNKFNEITNNNEEKKVIETLWNFCYDQLRNKIWLRQVEEVISIEKSKGIDGVMKRKKRDKEGDNIGNNDNKKNNNNKKRRKENKQIKNNNNNNNNIKLVTEANMIQDITDGKSVKKIWYTKMKVG